MTQLERISRILKIQPQDLALWTRLCRNVNKQIAMAHPDYPRLEDMQLLSFVKRLLPEIRSMMESPDRTPAGRSAGNTNRTKSQSGESSGHDHPVRPIH